MQGAMPLLSVRFRSHDCPVSQACWVVDAVDTAWVPGMADMVDTPVGACSAPDLHMARDSQAAAWNGCCSTSVRRNLGAGDCGAGRRTGRRVRPVAARRE